MEEKSSDLDKSMEDETTLLEILKVFAPGTSLRLALDDIQRGGLGALIVIGEEGVSGITDGGFEIDCKFSPQKLMELAKMDGAIILSEDLKRILQANTLLVPRSDISTKETGTRHKAAERTAKQLNLTVVAVSERKNKITVYHSNLKHTLEPSSEVLRRAIEILQILEKQVEIYHESLLNLNILEFMDVVSYGDVASVVQRAEIIHKISNSIKRFLVELGKEGTIVSFRLKELTKNVRSEKRLILKDYFMDDVAKIESLFENTDLDFLLESSDISEIFFERKDDQVAKPKGIRILSKMDLSDKDKEIVLNNSNSLNQILAFSEEELVSLFKNDSSLNNFVEELKKIKEKISSGKKI